MCFLQGLNVCFVAWVSVGRVSFSLGLHSSLSAALTAILRGVCFLGLRLPAAFTDRRCFLSLLG
jgi:hypothetical protein